VHSLVELQQKHKILPKVTNIGLQMFVIINPYFCVLYLYIFVTFLFCNVLSEFFKDTFQNDSIRLANIYTILGRYDFPQICKHF
jgi:hypothetical protein